MKIISFCLLTAFLVLSSSPAFAEQKKLSNIEIITLFKLEVLGGFSGLTARNITGGGVASLDFSPTIKFDENNYLIPLFSATIKRKVQVIPEEEGGELTVMDQNHNLYLAYKHLFNQRISTRIAGFGTWSLNKETRDESWGTGLYDYRDFGGNINFQFKTAGNSPLSQGTLSSTTEGYLRRYPNYQSLVSLTVNNAPEEDEKDYRALRQMVDYQWRPSSNFLANLGYSFLNKHYIDKLVVDANGFLTNKKRLDYLHNFNISLFYTLVKQWQLKLNAMAFLNYSNQNYYDTRATLALGDDVYTRSYFNYTLGQLNPSLVFFYPLPGKDRDFILEGGYDFLVRAYSNRIAETERGIYTPDTQNDYQHSLMLKAIYPINKYFSMVALGEYIINTSNMDFERYYLYNYHSYAMWSGVSFRY